jgi:hypothetical protein
VIIKLAVTKNSAAMRAFSAPLFTQKIISVQLRRLPETISAAEQC